MSTRTTAVGTQSSSDVLTAAEYNDAAGGWIGWVKITANATTVTTPADLVGLTVAPTVGTSRLIKVEYSVGMATSAASGLFQILVLKDGTQVSRFNYYNGDGAASTAAGFVLDSAPSAGAHTYKLQGGRSGADSGTWTPVGASDQPSLLLVSDIGPS